MQFITDYNISYFGTTKKISPPNLKCMEKKIFLLDPNENTRTVKVFQLILGILCLLVSLYWIFIYLKSAKTTGSMWITIAFLATFGFYQVMSGLGKTQRYIETAPDRIKIKQHSFLPSVVLKPEELELIELYPLSMAFHLKNQKKSIFRFGITYTDIVQPVKDSIAEFANINNISLEVRKEEI